MGWANFNDRLALLLLGGLPVLWALQGLGVVSLPGEITGATIAGWTLVLQYYFRRAPPSSGGSNGGA